MTTQAERAQAAHRAAMPRPIVTIHVTRAAFDTAMGAPEMGEQALEMARMIEAGALVIDEAPS